MAYTPRTYTTEDIFEMVVSLMDPNVSEDQVKDVARDLGIKEGEFFDYNYIVREILSIFQTSVEDDMKAQKPIPPHPSVPVTPPYYPPGVRSPQPNIFNGSNNTNEISVKKPLEFKSTEELEEEYDWPMTWESDGSIFRVDPSAGIQGHLHVSMKILSEMGGWIDMTIPVNVFYNLAQRMVR